MSIKNGDFAGFLDEAARSHADTPDTKSSQTLLNPDTDKPEVFDSEAFTEMLMDDEKLEAYAEKMRTDAEEQADLEPMSDEEFERQALEAGGDDHDASTPE
jgi:hypothetical protein